MKKIGIKKVLLYISLLPYVYCIIMSLYHAIFGYTYNSEFIEADYGIEAIMTFLSNYWMNNIIFLNVAGMINIFAILYPIYFFISYKRIDKVKVESKVRKINLKKIFFVISIVCFIAFSIIPILPISLIYIIIYLIVRYKEKRKQNN